jgi:hypothetical protein
MLLQVHDALLRAMSGIELSRVRTELRLLPPEAYQQNSDRVERAPALLCNQAPGLWLCALGGPFFAAVSAYPALV